MAEMPLGSKSSQINKVALRPHYIQLRKNISPVDRLSPSNIILKKILSQPIVEQAKTTAVYISTPSEVDTRTLIKHLLAQKKALYAPAVVGNDLVIRRLTSLDDCVVGQNHILEPPHSAATIHPSGVDLFIVPGLSFDAYGYRLGYGKGYYDRLLADTAGFKLGLGFTDQLCFQLPHDSHDVKMNHVLTDSISLNIPF